MGTLLGPKYIPYTHMDPLGRVCTLGFRVCTLEGLGSMDNSRFVVGFGGVPSTLIRGYGPGLLDPDPKGAKDNSLNHWV